MSKPPKRLDSPPGVACHELALDDLEAPMLQTPYALCFSHDGTRLAMGGGCYYGMGWIRVVDLETYEMATFVTESLPGYPDGQNAVPTVSGLCFSGDDRYLAASMWRAYYTFVPSHLFEVHGLELKHVGRLGEAAGSHNRRENLSTGALITGGGVALYTLSETLGRLFLLTSPQGAALSPALAHLASHRLALLGGDLLVSAATKDARGLACRPLAGGETRLVDAPGLPGISAVVGEPGRATVIVGGHDGSLFRVERREDNRFVSSCLRESRPRKPRGTRHWHTYEPASVVGLCFAGDGETLYVLDAASFLGQWRGGEEQRECKLPGKGSARSLAAHPTRPLVAVGIKRGRVLLCEFPD